MTICINLIQSATLMATMYLAIDTCVWTYLINTCNKWVYSVNCTSKTQRYKPTEFIIRQSSINRFKAVTCLYLSQASPLISNVICTIIPPAKLLSNITYRPLIEADDTGR